MFAVRYPEIDSLALSDSIPVPTCIFYLQPNKVLIPAAIHMSPTSCDVITSKSDKSLWLHAKMCVKRIDAYSHLLVSRYMCTTLVSQAVYIATLRNLPNVHPVYKILHPHLKNIIAEATLQDEYLKREETTGIFGQILDPQYCVKDKLKNIYKKFHLDELNLPKDLMKRRVIDPHKLPNYYFRDDGLQLWKVLEKYLRTTLTLQYWSDDNVRKDEELQAWIRDIYENGLPRYKGQDNGVPNRIDKLEVCTR